MNWLITGGCGFIGTALAARLLREGQPVRVVDNLSVGSREDLAGVGPFVERPAAGLTAEWAPLELLVADIRDAETAIAAARGAQVIVHLAANTGVIPSIEDPVSDCHNNVLGTLNYLEAARRNGVGRFVFASSGAPLGEQEPPLHEEKVPRPISPYGASKLAGEGYCSAYFGSYGVTSSVLRFGNIYGPGSARKQSVVAKFLRRALAGEVLEVFGDGNQTRDFIYIDDIVDAIHRAASVPGIKAEVFQIASQQEHTVNEIAAIVRELVAVRSGRSVQLIHEPARAGEVLRNYSDIGKAKKVLGFAPRVALREGIERTLNDFLNNKAGIWDFGP